MLLGTVSWFDPRRHMALIRPDTRGGRAGREILVHASDLDGSGLPAIQAGQRIAFEITEHDGHRQLRLDAA